MSTVRRQVARYLLVLLCGMLSACTSLFGGEPVPINFYLLTPVTAQRLPSATSGPIFAIAPVRVPQYLTQRGLVTRAAQSELNVAADDQWGGPLADNIAGVLSENISLMIPSDRVVELPVSSAVPVDYEIRVEVVSFQRQPDGTVELVARWTVFGEGGAHLVAMRRSSFQSAVVAEDYPQIVATMSGLLSELSREIADTLRTITARPVS